MPLDTEFSVTVMGLGYIGLPTAAVMAACAIGAQIGLHRVDRAQQQRARALLSQLVELVGDALEAAGVSAEGIQPAICGDLRRVPWPADTPVRPGPGQVTVCSRRWRSARGRSGSAFGAFGAR